MLKKCCDYFYEIYFVLELDANILIIQLNQSANDLSEALVTDWIAWIQLFNFIIKHVLRNKHTVINKLSYQSKIENKNKKEKNINNFIDFQLNIVRILNLKLNKLKNEILKSEYSLEHQQITYYFTSLQKSIDISQSNFWKFHKKTMQYFV